MLEKNRKGQYKLKVRGLISLVENKGRDFSPLSFFKACILENL